jgi:ABC-type branched-subunit amino acid transport system ATPase component
MTVKGNLIMGTITIGDKNVGEDMHRMFDLFPA